MLVYDGGLSAQMQARSTGGRSLTWFRGRNIFNGIETLKDRDKLSGRWIEASIDILCVNLQEGCMCKTA